MQDDKTNDKADQKAPIKKRSILDNVSPNQRRLFEKMGIVLRVENNDNDNEKK
jgi:hypothetical protein